MVLCVNLNSLNLDTITKEGESKKNMNILRLNRKSKGKSKFNKFIMLIFSLIMTTFAWFTYSRILDTTLDIHLASWDMEYYIGEEKQENPIGIEFQTLYPAMPEQTVTIDIKNNGETSADIGCQIKSITIAGISYELINEGETNITENYIVIKQPSFSIDSATRKLIYRNTIINDSTRFPFTLNIEYLSEVDEATQGTPGTGYFKATVNWIGNNDELDSKWGYTVGEYLMNNPTETSVMSIGLTIDSYQSD